MEISEMTTVEMAKLTHKLVTGLVDVPGAVKVDGSCGGELILLTVTVDPEDLGKCVGKKGRTASALRLILTALCRKRDLRCELNFRDTLGSDGRRNGGAVPTTNTER